MTEQGWLASENLQVMLRRLDKWPSPSDTVIQRKPRLFACACVRQAWHLLTDERSRKAVGVAENYVDRQATTEELSAARVAAWAAARDATGNAAGAAARSAARATARYAARYAAWDAARGAARGAARDAARAAAWDVVRDAARDAAWNAAVTAAGAQQAHILRDVVGNPWQLVPAIAVSPVVHGLARATYADHNETGLLAPDRLAVLADALEEAGCDYRPALDHLRAPGPHVRGCWVLDVILDKCQCSLDTPSTAVDV